VLHRYDEHLTEIEREFLKVFSAFRIPVHQNAIKQVFKKLLDFPDSQSLGQTLSRLLDYRILRFNTISSTYTIHPLIRAHYIKMLSSDIPDRIKVVHATIKKYYIAIARQQIDNTKLENLTPLLEAIHYACLCDDFDGAIHLLRKIEKGYDSTLMFLLGAYDTYIELARAFFPDGDFSREPLVNLAYRRILYGDLGIAFGAQCSPYEAERFHVAALKLSIEKKKSVYICDAYQNLSETYLYMGEFKKSEDAALLGVDFAHHARNPDEEWTALAYGAFAAYLMGAMYNAEERFGQALHILRKIRPNIPYLLDMWGGWHALYLLRMNQPDEARAILMFNFEECAVFPEVMSQLYSVLGDCYSVDHQSENALKNYDQAVQIGRAISSQAILVEALIKRGYFFARHAKNYEEAFIDLGEALHYLKLGECRWYEADIYLALAWAYLANGEAQKAKESASRALQMSEEMGYYWGKLDAEEVLERVENRE
jgi:tetratricopeptide (TPR) repeat protein